MNDSTRPEEVTPEKWWHLNDIRFVSCQRCLMIKAPHSRQQTEHNIIIIYVSCVCGLVATPQKVNLARIMIVYACCTTWHFLNMGQNFTPNFNLFDAAVAALHTHTATCWLAVNVRKKNRSLEPISTAITHIQWNSIRFYRFPFDSLHAPNGNKGNDTLTTEPGTVPNRKWSKIETTQFDTWTNFSLHSKFRDHILSK